MTDRCDDLHAYVDGELAEDEAAEFEAHLASCATCAAELPRLLALLAALDNAAAHALPRAAQLTVLPGGRATEAPAPEAPAPEAGAPEAPPPET
ncbi:MAG TPA: zf-HC2 domain-containing protein, partial [Kofleriaceae bacterium]